MNVDQSKIYLLNKEEFLLVHFSESQQSFFESNIGIVGNVVLTKEIANINNAYSHPQYNGMVDLETTLPIICIPIMHPDRKEVMGVYEILNPKGLQGSLAKQKSKINGVEYEILQFFTLQLSQIINNIQEWEKIRGINSLSKKSVNQTNLTNTLS